MNNQNQNFKNIPGWGMDIDPENEPTYPIKNYTGDDHKRSNYEKAEQQPVNIELLKSNERPHPSAVFGTSVPPSGLSGAIRRYAFKHSEDRYRHWIPLILADRVNAWEGIIEDFKKGIIPDIVKEKGWKSEFRYNPVGMIGRAAITLAVGGLVIRYLFKRK